MADVGAGQMSPARKVLYWWDPMMPAHKSDKPGKSPMGMDMVPVYEGAAPSSEAEGVVTVSPAVIQSLGVRTAVAKRTSLTPVIETFGTVGFDESRISHVNVRAKGKWFAGGGVLCPSPHPRRKRSRIWRADTGRMSRNPRCSS